MTSVGDLHSAGRAPATIAVYDPVGEIFERLQTACTDAALWRVKDSRATARDTSADRVVYAAYTTLDWESIARLSRRATVLAITTVYERSEAEEALRWALLGYLDAALPEPAFSRGVRGALFLGEPGFARDVIGAWMSELRAVTRAKSVNGLTMRQYEILALIAKGATDKEIGARLGIATTTAQKHVTRLLRRLDVPNRAAAAATLVAPPVRRVVRPDALQYLGGDVERAS